MNGFVKRIVHANEIPVVIEYLPKDYCGTLTDVIQSLAEWAKKHKKKITAKA